MVGFEVLKGRNVEIKLKRQIKETEDRGGKKRRMIDKRKRRN